MRFVLVAALLMTLAAGCLEGQSAAAAATADPVPSTSLAVDTASGVPAPAAFAPAMVPEMAVLRPGLRLDWEGRCPCPAYAFELRTGGWDGWLDVRLQWDGTETAGIGLILESPDGRTASGARGFDDRLVRLWAPADGKHLLRLDGAGSFVASARFGSLAVPAEGPLLPNLVEMVLEGPRVGACDASEQAEQGAVRCLRFGNGVGNPGHGPVQVRLTVEQGVQALAPLGGRFVQEIRRADGDVDEREVGPASFHTTHTHWHYDGLALFELHGVDESTGLRGPVAASHGKSGFCFLDWDRMLENVTVPEERERAEADCLVPGLGAVLSGSMQPPAWTNGISRGWYDYYTSSLSDQYVDIAGLPDGLYELVATADPLDTLLELDETDNKSSLLIRISGDDVEVLEERAHYRVQDEDDK